MAEKNKVQKKLDEDELQMENRQIEQERRMLTIRHDFLVQMGNWFEDFGLSETRSQYNDDNLLMFNVPIQIESNYTNPTSENPEIKFLLNVVLPDPKYTFLYEQTYNMDNLLPITALPYRIHSNIFKCVNIAGVIIETPILYGEDFYICINNTKEPTLFLTGVTPYDIDVTNEKMPMALSPYPSKYSRFRILDPEPERMNTLEGTPVRIKTRVCLVHVYFNKLLAVDFNDFVDFGIHCYTYRDEHDCIASENFWKFMNPSFEKE